MNTLLLADPRHARDQSFKFHGTKAEVLAARCNRRRDLVRFGGAQHEHGPGGRLLDGLQQRVEGFVGDLVRFVDDEYLVTVARRLVAHVLAQFAHFIDAAVGCSVDLDHIHRAARRDFCNHDTARLAGWTVHAIEAARQNARHGGLAGPALPRKNVAVRDAVLRDGVFERGLDVLLVHHVGERLGPVLAGDDLVHGWANARPRVIRGTQVKPLPLLPSGPGGVCGRLSHGARDLTIDYRIMQPPAILITLSCIRCSMLRSTRTGASTC